MRVPVLSLVLGAALTDAAAPVEAKGAALNATVEAARLEKIASSLSKVVVQPHAPQGAATVLKDVQAAADKLKKTEPTNQVAIRSLVRNATAEVLALQARLQSRMKELKAEDKKDNAPPSYDKEAALQKLTGIQKSLQKLNAKHGLEDGDAVLRDLDYAVTSVKAEKDPAKIQQTMVHMMSELHAFQKALEAKVAQETSEHAEAPKDQSQVLFDALYDIQDLPLQDQLAVVQKPQFKDIPAVQKLLASKPTGEEPLAIAFGKILDADSDGHRATGHHHKFVSHKETVKAIEEQILKDTKLTKDKAAVLAPIVVELEGRLDRVDRKRGALLDSQDRIKDSTAKLESSANKNAAQTGDDAGSHKAKMMVKYLRKRTSRQFKKQEASLDAESKALHDAIAAIKAGKVDQLQAAMKRLNDMKGEKQQFLH